MRKAAEEANVKKQKTPSVPLLMWTFFNKMDSCTKLMILCWHSGGADNFM